MGISRSGVIKWIKEGKIKAIDMIVIAYAERRKRITKGKSTKTRSARKALRKLREKEKKQDIIYKAARIIEQLVIQNSAVVAVGNAHRGKKRLVEK